MKDYKKILKGVVNIIKTTEKTDIGFANICSYLSDNCDELFDDGDEKIRKEIIMFIKKRDRSGCDYNYDKWIAWLEKQGKKEVDTRYENLKELLAADDIYQMSITDAMVNEAKEKAIKALSELCIGKLLGLEKQDEHKPNPYSGTSFEYNGHIWGMCARDNGVDILLDKQLFKHLEKQQSVEEIVERCKNSWFNEGKIQGMKEGLTDDEKYQQGWHDALEKQGNKFVNIDIESMVSAYKQRLKNQGQGDMENSPLVNMCLIAFRHGVENVLEELNLKKLEKQGEKSQNKSEIERIRKAINEEKADNQNCVKGDGEIGQKFHEGDIVQYITDSTDRRKIEEVDTLCNMYHTDDSPIMFEVEDEWKVVVKAEDVEQKPTDKVEPKFKVKYACGEYNVVETKEIAGVTYYGIEDEPNHIDYVLPEDCEIISGYGVKDKGNSYPTKSAIFSEQNSAWSNGYSNGYIQAVEKAVEWLENHNDYIDVKDGNVTYFDMGKCVEDFRKAMEGGEE